MTTRARYAHNLPRFAWGSALAALITIALKTTAWGMTGSVGLLSDALESLVNMAAAMLAIAMLTVAARPEDDDHPYGHDKAEYFSSGAEGALILVAAAGIALAAVRRLIAPQALDQIGSGLVVSSVATVVNLVTALVIGRAGRQHHSVTLEANAQHLLADVWTSVAVLVGVGLVMLTGLQWLDPIVALLVSLNIVATGLGIMRRAVIGLMDAALSSEDQDMLRRALAPHVVEPVQVHALRSRQSGARRFVSMHVLVPGDWSVQRGHELLERIEADIRRAIPSASVLTHLESLDDPASWDDIPLDREQPPTKVS